MKLYNFTRSSASFRVRIALNLKGLHYDYVSVGLRANEHRTPAYLAKNPQGFVPALETDDGDVLAQSLAIIEYLDEIHPHPAFLPRDPVSRARVRALALTVACDIHPLNNLQVLHYLQNDLGLDQGARDTWYRHWVAVGFQALEGMLKHPSTGTFCHGEQPTLADIYLVPQVINAQRFDCDLTPYPTITRIFEACMALDAFAEAHPRRTPDAIPD